MKKLLLSASFALVGFTGFGQITINQSDFPFVPKTFNQQADSLSFTIPATGAGKTWNLSTMQKINGRTEVTYGPVSNVPGVTEANEQSLGKTQFGPVLADVKIYYEKASDGYHQLGIGYDEQAYSLEQVSGNNNDTMYIPVQINKYASKRPLVKFPLTMGTSWSGQYVQRSDFLMTITALGYNKTPWTVLSYNTFSSSVDGWGDLTIPNKGSASTTMPSLLLKTETTRIDSFFIDGQPANPFLLAAIGLSQGDVENIYEYTFYRKNGGIQSLANIQFSDNTYSTVDYAQYSAEFDAAGIKNENLATAIIFPNPVSGNSLYMTLSRGTAASVSVTDIAGRQINALLQATGQGYQVSLPEGTAPGIYFLQVFDAENNKLANSKFIVNR